MTSSETRNPQSLIARLWPWLAAVLSGVLLTLCYPSWDQGWLCWIALMPLAAAAFTPGGPWRRAALGYVAGYVFFASTFWWLNSLAALYRNPVSVEACRSCSRFTWAFSSPFGRGS